VAGVFLSADTKEGNAQGMNPYAYVAQNPETLTDPSGQYFAPPGGNGNGDPNPPSCEQENDCGSGNSGYPTPQPPSPTPQPHAPGHGMCSEGNPPQCGSDPAKPTPTAPTTAQTVQPGGCDAQCENDKLLVQQYIQNERAKAEALNSAVGDILSLAADIFAAAADFAADAYLAFIIDVITIAGHFVALLSNLSTMGLISIPSWLTTLGDMFQNGASILAGIKGVVQYFGLGPLAGIAGGLVKSATLAARAGLMGIVSSLVGEGFAEGNDYLDETKYNGALDAVDGYNAQTAYNICLQDYSSDPARC